jgi:hypothetical protein
MPAGSLVLIRVIVTAAAPATDQRGLRTSGAYLRHRRGGGQYPLFQPDTDDTAEDSPVTIAVLANDSSPEGPATVAANSDYGQVGSAPRSTTPHFEFQWDGRFELCCFR